MAEVACRSSRPRGSFRSRQPILTVTLYVVSLPKGLSLYEVKELAGHAKIETTERFYLAVRRDVVDRARAASDASRKGNSVAHLLRAPLEDEKGRRLSNTSA
jgi:hypothetical protein